MIVRASELIETNCRTDYGVGRLQEVIKHFVVRRTGPGNPFGPHKHDGAEFWFILGGEAIVSIDGVESRLSPGDLAILPPWSEHGLRSESEARWVCFG